jgi:hypothetical protein
MRHLHSAAEEQVHAKVVADCGRNGTYIALARRADDTYLLMVIRARRNTLQRPLSRACAARLARCIEQRGGYINRGELDRLRSGDAIGPCLDAD